MGDKMDNGNGARAQATLSAIIKWGAGLLAVAVAATVGWNFHTLMSDGDRLTALEIAETKDVERLKEGQALRYTSYDAARNRANNDQRLDAIERRLEHLDGDPLKKPKPLKQR
jgi:hypothetical protein